MNNELDHNSSDCLPAELRHIRLDTTAVLAELTPEIAAKLLGTFRLEDFGDNFSIHLVVEYAMQIRAGEWALSPDEILIDHTGRLQNGRLRLLAVVLAAVPQKFFVRFQHVHSDV